MSIFLAEILNKVAFVYCEGIFVCFFSQKNIGVQKRTPIFQNFTRINFTYTARICCSFAFLFCKRTRAIMITKPIISVTIPLLIKQTAPVAAIIR